MCEDHSFEGKQGRRKKERRKGGKEKFIVQKPNKDIENKRKNKKINNKHNAKKGEKKEKEEKKDRLNNR